MKLSPKITLIAADPSRLDPLAVDQLETVAQFAGMKRVVGLPDRHAGNGIAVGAVRRERLDRPARALPPTSPARTANPTG